MLGNTYRISVKSFYQVNPVQVEHLYQKAIAFAELKSTDEVIDAYCGIGTISLSMAQYVKKVYGVEIVKQAIIDAKENADRNNISNVDFTCQDAGEFMVDFAKKNKHIDVVMVDPPRKGCSQVFLDQLDVYKRQIHSLCVRILRQNIRALDYPNNFIIMDEEDQKSLLKKIFKDKNIDSKTMSVKSCIHYISSVSYTHLDVYKRQKYMFCL